MEGKYDSEGRPLLSDWPELTRSDEIKRNMERLKYGFVRHSDELYHYGVIGMKWGVHRAKAHFAKGERIRKKSNDIDLYNDKDPNAWTRSIRKSDRHYEKGSAIEVRVRKKAEAKLAKLDRQYQKEQAKADEYFAKGERKANSLLGSKRAADRAFRKATKKQFKANKVAAKGKRWYEQMQKSYKKLGRDIPESSRKTGEEFIRQVRANSRAMYAASYAGG